MKRALFGFVTAAVGLLVIACATAPKTESEREALMERAEATLSEMKARDPGLQQVLDDAYGYVVFPSVGKGGVIVGGAYGKGIVYEQGQPVGFAELNQASLGAQLGAQTFAELIVFDDPVAFRGFQRGGLDFGARASAVALTAGAAASTQFEQGVAVFTMPRGGLMVDISVSGQEINYQAAGAAPPRQ